MQKSAPLEHLKQKTGGKEEENVKKYGKKHKDVRYVLDKISIFGQLR